MLPGLELLLAECAPQVAPDTMAAIVRVESGGNPLAINVNGGQRLARQPASKAEALDWTSWLIARGYSVDMGLSQVNSRNLRRLGVSSAQMFEPCDNLKAGARILSENYAGASQRYGAGPSALRAAISAYNTGNYRGGFANGYVAKVSAAAEMPGGSPPPLVAVDDGAKESNAAIRKDRAHNHGPQVFIFGRGESLSDRPHPAGSPLVRWVSR